MGPVPYVFFPTFLGAIAIHIEIHQLWYQDFDPPYDAYLPFNESSLDDHDKKPNMIRIIFVF